MRQLTCCILLLGATLTLTACNKKGTVETPTVPTSPVKMASAPVTSGTTPPATGGTTSTTPSAPADGWQTYTPTGGQCSVQMPAKPDEAIIPTQTASGQVENHMMSLQDKADVYAVSYADFPEAVVKSSSPEKLIGGARDNIQKVIGGHLVDNKSITLNGHTGQEWTMELPKSEQMPQGGFYLGHAFLVGNRFYQIYGIASDAAGKEHIQRFVESFKLTGS